MPTSMVNSALGVKIYAVLACGLFGVLHAPDAGATEPEAAKDAPTAPAGKIDVEIDNGKYHVVIDMRGSPELQGWAEEKLAPVVAQWYPMIVRMLPSRDSEGRDFEPAREFTITISDGIEGVAYTSRSQVHCNGKWFQQNRDGEAVGAVVHELVHVVQQYPRRRRNSTRPPGWLVEGIADYIRWFLYEPETGGALINTRGAARARHDASYRTSANFLNWVADNYGAGLIPKLNAQLRNGGYDAQFWQQQTGKTVDQLAVAWKSSLGQSRDDRANDGETDANELTAEEKTQGWQLLFDGKSTAGWHSFKRDEVLPGWKVADGKLVCQDPSQAGDLCTDESYEWFELRLDYNISQGGNSGIMFHVTDEGRAAWATGPEFQLEDNLEAHDPTRCGWLYALYQPSDDPDTGKPIDATKPAGQWNQVRLLVSPTKCVHEVNGVEYVTYQLGSEDFRNRVQASKFASMPLFAKPSAGMIALQGDHGVISFRNVKLRPISEE